MTEFTRPYLYPKQREALFCPERWALIEASTKSGKTVGSMAWIVERALMGKIGQNRWWVAPGYSQAEIAYRRIKAGLTPGSFTCTETPTPKITVASGGTLWFKSGDNPDALYGEDVYDAVIDEASRVRDDSWHAVRSTLTATRGSARIIGNVKGRKNWFYAMCRQAEAGAADMHYARITAIDAVAAGVLDAAEIDDARRTLPENVFRELYFAEPGDDTGNPFGSEHIKACVRDGLAPGPVKAWGIDLAKSQDYFVCIGLNEQCQVCALVRWRNVPWRESIKRVWALVGEDTPALVDSTGLGDPVLEELQHDHGNFIGFHFSSVSKQKLMEGLTVSIQSHEIGYPDGQIRQELENFEYVFTRTGVRYQAAEGHNDDCVAALALARQMWSETAPGASIMQFYVDSAARAKAKEEKETEKEDLNTFRRQPKIVDADETFDRELTDLYNETVMKLESGTNKNVCAACNEPVGNNRVTDGANVWHPTCPCIIAKKVTANAA